MFSSIRAWIRDLYRRRFHSDLIAHVISHRFVAQRELGRDHIPDMPTSLLRELVMRVEACTGDFYEMTALFSEFVPGVRPVIFASEKCFLVRRISSALNRLLMTSRCCLNSDADNECLTMFSRHGAV